MGAPPDGPDAQETCWRWNAAARASARRSPAPTRWPTGSTGSRPSARPPPSASSRPGTTTLDVRQALRTLGLDDTELSARGVRLLRLAMVHPLIAAEVEEFADGLTEIIVVEEKRAFIESAVKEILYGKAGCPPGHGQDRPAGSEAVRGRRGTGRGPDRDRAGRPAGLAAGIQTATAWQARHAPGRPVTPLPLYVAAGWAARRTSAPAARTTAPPRCPRAGWWEAGSVATPCRSQMEPEAVGDGSSGLPRWAARGAQWIGMAPFHAHPAAPAAEIGDG